MQLRSLRRTFSGTQLKFWIGRILHMLHYKMACIHSPYRLMTAWLHPQITLKRCIIIFDHFQKTFEKAHGLVVILVGHSFIPLTSTALEYSLKSTDKRLTFAWFIAQSSWSGGWSQQSCRWDNICNNYAGHFSLYLISTYLNASTAAA